MITQNMVELFEIHTYYNARRSSKVARKFRALFRLATLARERGMWVENGKAISTHIPSPEHRRREGTHEKEHPSHPHENWNALVRIRPIQSFQLYSIIKLKNHILPAPYCALLKIRDRNDSDDNAPR